MARPGRGGRLRFCAAAKPRFLRTGEKMRHFRVGVAVVAFALMLAPVLPAQLTETPEPGQTRTFQLTAENYQFSPFNIIVNRGDKVRFVVTAADRDYEFKLKAYDIKEKVAQGVPAT